MLNVLLGALGGAFSFAVGILKWFTFKRTKNIGKMEGELERRREEDERSRARRKLEAEVSDLSRDDIVERLRNGSKPSGD